MGCQTPSFLTVNTSCLRLSHIGRGYALQLGYFLYKHDPFYFAISSFYLAFITHTHTFNHTHTHTDIDLDMYIYNHIKASITFCHHWVVHGNILFPRCKATSDPFLILAIPFQNDSQYCISLEHCLLDG